MQAILKNIHLFNKNRIFISHVLFWVFLALFNYIINLIQYLGVVYIEDSLCKFLIAAFIFYANVLFILPRYFRKKRFVAFSLALVLLAFISFALKEILYSKILTLFRFPSSPYTLLQSFVMNLWWWFQYTMFGFGYWFAKQLIAREHEKLQLEKEKLRAEYAFLKAQINPHFLINVLNFFYSKSSSEELSNGILYLADILRYINAKEEDEDGLIPLLKEVDQINNIININKLRFDNNLNINFSIAGDLSRIKVPPYVYITLIENAFKHGRLIENGDPLVIRFECDNHTNALHFYLKNRKNYKQVNNSSGIGLENIKKRLKFTYGENYELNIQDDLEYFQVTLSINFKS